MKGNLYGVGVGPGDSELLTLKAVRIIRQCKYIAVPKTNSGRQLALEICKDYIAGKKIINLETPMTYDEIKLKNSYQYNAESIAQKLSKGSDVVFLTLGDPSIYSTYTYTQKIIKDMGYGTETIPGVPSFCAAAAAANISLCEKDQSLHIIPSSYYDYKTKLNSNDSYVFMKSGKKITELIDHLNEKDEFKNAILIENASMESQRVIKDLSEIPEDIGYFNIVIYKEEKQ